MLQIIGNPNLTRVWRKINAGNVMNPLNKAEKDAIFTIIIPPNFTDIFGEPDSALIMYNAACLIGILVMAPKSIRIKRELSHSTIAWMAINQDKKESTTYSIMFCITALMMVCEKTTIKKEQKTYLNRVRLDIISNIDSEELITSGNKAMGIFNTLVEQSTESFNAYKSILTCMYCLKQYPSIQIGRFMKSYLQSTTGHKMIWHRFRLENYKCFEL